MTEHGTAAKLFRYVGTGGLAAVVDIGGFALLTRAGVAVPVAAATSFCVAAVVNYLLSSRLAFGRDASWRGFALFFAVALIGLCINVGVTVAGTDIVHLPPVIAKIAGVGIAFLVNFALNLTIVFGRGDSAAGKDVV